MPNCIYCGRECKNENSLRNHQRLCALNPNRQFQSKKTERDAAKWRDFPHTLLIVGKTEIKEIRTKCFNLFKDSISSSMVEQGTLTYSSLIRAV